MNYSIQKKQKGFTLIEMLVAVGLFSIVMLISTAVIFSIVNGNRKSQTINTVVNNLNFSIESVIRDIKTGYWYQCYNYPIGNWPTIEEFKANYFSNAYPCTGSSNFITFISTISSDGEPHVVSYYLIPETASNPGQIWKAYKDTDNPVDDAITSVLTSKEINVNQFDMYINNPPPNTDIDKSQSFQPGVFLMMKGNVKVGNKDTDVSEFGVQTYISQRYLNI